ncbi:short-chain dehydrogenase/reductase family protein [Blastocystis sp. ATCC 50177/Nand II]|uniref:Short-chain dehydrogenase/reductase family protein n=1 Tax=Blastocystis sp. subtype 1 (strain ATCC 50177 / NandII) TaxID=478820 RepID=A0A196SHG4_BLAHN|nr:short-chain dehydrogenase/reductase family protein [Blastocystis sp. ATCC 50177/Nand II]
MQFVSYLSSIPLKVVSLAVSVPIAVLGTCYDALFKKLPDEPHKILITGASSGICKEVALQYAKPGNSLFLVARNVKRLNEVADAIRKAGATVEVASIDACDEQKMKDYIQEKDREYKLDLVIAGVGAVAPANANDMELSELYDYIIKTNILTCKNTVLPVIDSMRERRHGQICILSSVAGLGMNFISPMYSSCKVAVYSFGEALRTMLTPYGVYVNIVCPGYTDTPILDTNTGKNIQYKLSPKHVATMIVDGLKRDDAVIECNML